MTETPAGSNDTTPEHKTPREAIQNKNGERLQALANAGTPVQVNGLEEHVLLYLLEATLGPDGTEDCLLQWAQKVDAHLDSIEEQIRFAKLTQGVGGIQQPRP